MNSCKKKKNSEHCLCNFMLTSRFLLLSFLLFHLVRIIFLQFTIKFLLTTLDQGFFQSKHILLSKNKNNEQRKGLYWEWFLENFLTSNCVNLTRSTQACLMEILNLTILLIWPLIKKFTIHLATEILSVLHTQKYCILRL